MNLQEHLTIIIQVCDALEYMAQNVSLLRARIDHNRLKIAVRAHGRCLAELFIAHQQRC